MIGKHQDGIVAIPREKKKHARPATKESSSKTSRRSASLSAAITTKSIDPNATTFVIRSHKNREARPILCISLILGLGVYLLWSDWNIQNDLLWFGGGLLMGFVVLETVASFSTVEVSVRISPLGVQISNRRYHHHVAPTSDNLTLGKTKSKFKQPPPKYEPFLPTEVVEDCILVEHVGVFGVSTRLVLRLRPSKSPLSKSIVPILPKSIQLSFAQCQELAEQIRHSLER